MKKLFLLLTIVFGFLACEGPMGPEGPKGPPGEGTGWKIIYMYILENEWEEIRSGNETYYTFTYRNSDITQYVYDEGAMIVHQILNFDNPEENQTPLPRVYHHVDKDGYKWTETIEYIYKPGSITFFMTFSDGIPRIPLTCDFKISMIW